VKLHLIFEINLIWVFPKCLNLLKFQSINQSEIFNMARIAFTFHDNMVSNVT